jgi:hypothetical protein
MTNKIEDTSSRARSTHSPAIQKFLGQDVKYFSLESGVSSPDQKTTRGKKPKLLGEKNITIGEKKHGTIQAFTILAWASF